MPISLDELHDLLLKFIQESRKFNQEHIDDDKWEAKKVSEEVEKEKTVILI